MSERLGDLVLMEFTTERGWWFAPRGELRECFVTTGRDASTGRIDLFKITDAGTGFPIDAEPSDVLTEGSDAAQSDLRGG